MPKTAMRPDESSFTNATWIGERHSGLPRLQLLRFADRGVAGRVELDSVHDLEREADLEYFDRVELKFRVQAALDVSGLTKAVLLARKQEVTNWFALATQRFN